MSKKTARKPAANSGVHHVNTGMNYGPDNRRAEPGDEVTDLPTESVAWLIAQGHVTPVVPAADRDPVEGDN